MKQMTALNYSFVERCHNKFSPRLKERRGIPSVPHHVFTSQIQPLVQFTACCGAESLHTYYMNSAEHDSNPPG